MVKFLKVRVLLRTLARPPVWSHAAL